MYKFFRSRARELGFTLSEMVTAGALMTLVVGGGATLYQRYLRSSQESDLRESMYAVRKEIEVAFSNPRILTSSMSHPENKEYFSCFGSNVVSFTSTGLAIGKKNADLADAGLSAGCKFTQPDRFYPLVLQSLRGGVLSGGTSSPEGVRSTNSLRILTARGIPCSDREIATADDRCEIEVTTAFRAVCAPDRPGNDPAGECVAPDSAEFFYTIRQLKSGNFFKRGIVYPSLNNMIHADGSARTRVDAISVNARDFLRPDFFQCPDGQTMRGVDKNGRMLCGLQENPCARIGEEFRNWIFHGVNPDGTLNCKRPLQGESCPTPENPLLVLRGVNKDGSLDCVDPKITNQGCADGQVLVSFDRQGEPVCVESVVGKNCPLDKFLVGFDTAGNPRCVSMETPGDFPFRIEGPKCGHQHRNCAYTSANKPQGYVPTCPEGTRQVNIGYRSPHCCATCGWIGQWWCDYLYVDCQPITTAKWQ